MCIVLIVSPIVYIDLGYFYKPNANCIFMIGLVWLLMMRMFKIWEIPKPEVAAVYPRRKKCSPGNNVVLYPVLL